MNDFSSNTDFASDATGSIGLKVADAFKNHEKLGFKTAGKIASEYFDRSKMIDFRDIPNHAYIDQHNAGKRAKSIAQEIHQPNQEADPEPYSVELYVTDMRSIGFSFIANEHGLWVGEPDIDAGAGAEECDRIVKQELAYKDLARSSGITTRMIMDFLLAEGAAKKKPTDALASQVDPLWKAITAMETPLSEVDDLVQALYLIASSNDDETSTSMMTIASMARQLCTQVDEQRSKCFKTLHALKFGSKSDDIGEVTA